MTDTKYITPSCDIIKKKKFLAKSPMFIRIGIGGNRNRCVFFSQSASRALGIKKYDKVVFGTQIKEVWIEKRNDGFPVVIDKQNVARINDSALTKWFIEKYRSKPPFRLSVVSADGRLYITKKIK